MFRSSEYAADARYGAFVLAAGKAASTQLKVCRMAARQVWFGGSI